MYGRTPSTLSLSMNDANHTSVVSESECADFFHTSTSKSKLPSKEPTRDQTERSKTGGESEGAKTLTGKSNNTTSGLVKQ